MKLSGENFKVFGTVAKQDERYVVTDNAELARMVLSSTDLNPGYSTTGHKHSGQEEIYIFVRGSGEMQVDDETIAVKSGDIINVQDGCFHRVFNTGQDNLYFICVFEGERHQ